MYRGMKFDWLVDEVASEAEKRGGFIVMDKRFKDLASRWDEEIRSAAKSKDSFYELANYLIDVQSSCQRQLYKNEQRGYTYFNSDSYSNFLRRESLEYEIKAKLSHLHLEKLKAYSIEYKSNWSDYFIVNVDMSSEIASRVRIIIADKLGVDENEVVPEAHFEIDLDADDLDIMELIMCFEKEFNIGIHDDQIESIDTVWAAIKFIENNIRKAE